MADTSAVPGKNIDIRLTGNLDNNGNLIAKDTTGITANNVNNTGVIQGSFVKISTNNDITNQGTLHAGSALSLDVGNKLINQSQTTTQTNTQGKSSSSRTSIKNQVSGNQVIISGVNTTLLATEVLADDDILIEADKDLNIGSAEDGLSRHSSEQTTKKGIFTTAPASVTLGKQHTRQENSHEQTTHTGSLIGTTGGNIRLESGDKIDVINSDIIAQKDETDANTGNILFKAQAVNITSQNTTTTNTHSFSQKTTGLTASVSSSLVSDIQSIETLEDVTQDTDSRRAKLMGGLAAASKTRTLVQNLQDGKLGSVRAEATIGSQSTKSDNHSHQETNDAANVHADGNLIFDVKGKGENSTLTVTGSNISVGQDLYNLVEGDVTYQAANQTSTTTSQNSSKGWGAGVYASANLSTDGLSSNSAGFTANANRAKGSSQETTITHTNTQVTVKGSTINNIGGNLTLDGTNLSANYLTGTVGKALIVKSRQDEYQYTHDQKQTGGSLDIAPNGIPQSANINAGKTDIDASHKQVTQQTGITAKQSTLSVQGQGNFTGGYLITDTGKNHTNFKQGITTQDIHNHLSYEGDAVSIGVGIGQNGISPTGLGYGTITPVHKTSATHSAITDQVGLSHINTGNFNQQEVQGELNQIITNTFNQEQVLKELNTQVTITQAFDAERRAIRTEYAKKAEDHRKEAEELPQGSQERTELEAKAKQIDDNLRIFDGITSALYAPNSNGIIGDVARAVSPELAYRIGQEFKENKILNQTDNGNRPEEQSLQHLLAHAILGAATNYATGNDIATGAISSAANEAVAPVLSNYLYGTKDPETLSQEQKDTIVSILNLATATAIYTTTDGSTTDAVSGTEIGKVGVENNNEMYLEAEREGAWVLANGDRDLYFKLTSLQGQLDIAAQSIERAHEKYNDMTIINLSGGVTGITFVINNKSGQVFSSGHPDINASQLANILSAGASVGFGSIAGGVKQPHEIDKIIEGSSFATQVCKALCIGEVVTPSGAKINTYGIGINIGYGSKLSGTRGVSASGSTMKKTKLILTPQQLKLLFKGGGR